MPLKRETSAQCMYVLTVLLYSIESKLIEKITKKNLRKVNMSQIGNGIQIVECVCVCLVTFCQKFSSSKPILTVLVYE